MAGYLLTRWLTLSPVHAGLEEANTLDEERLRELASKDRSLLAVCIHIKSPWPSK